MSVKKEKEIPSFDYEIPGIVIRDITKELIELNEQIISNERNCFGEDVSEWETYQEFMNADFCIAYGAFDSGKLIGSVVADQSDGDEPEIESLMVLKDYRGRGIAKLMLSKVMEILRARSADEIIIAVKNDNVPAIKLYSDMGFEVYRNEMMYMKYM
jgi:ribosomal protein S18 acetylase RimI-like enzyme